MKIEIEDGILRPGDHLFLGFESPNHTQRVELFRYQIPWDLPASVSEVKISKHEIRSLKIAQT